VVSTTVRPLYPRERPGTHCTGGWVGRSELKVKVKVPLTDLKAQKGRVEVQLYSSLTSTREGSGWSARRPGRFTIGKDPVPIVQEAGWAPGPVWTCAKILAPTGIRSPDRPARSQSLYRLSYPSLYCAASTGNLLPTFPDNLSVPTPGVRIGV
jgi:hypothetical protein